MIFLFCFIFRLNNNQKLYHLAINNCFVTPRRQRYFFVISHNQSADIFLICSIVFYFVSLRWRKCFDKKTNWICWLVLIFFFRWDYIIVRNTLCRYVVVRFYLIVSDKSRSSTKLKLDQQKLYPHGSSYKIYIRKIFHRIFFATTSKG